MKKMFNNLNNIFKRNVKNPEQSIRKIKRSSLLDEKKSLRDDITKFINKECSYTVGNIMQEKHITAIETQINVINHAIKSTNNKDIKQILDSFKSNIKTNPYPTIFNEYSNIFCKLKISNICNAFIELHSIYTYYNSGLQNLTYKIEESSDILENNLVSFIDNKTIDNKTIINHFNKNIYMFLLNNLYNPNFSSTQKRCLYFHNKSIIDYVQSILDVYNDFAKFIINNKTTNKTNIFQISIERFNKILNDDINIAKDIDKNIYEYIYRDIETIINLLKNRIIPDIINAFKYLDNLYLAKYGIKNPNEYFATLFGTKRRRRGGSDTIDYTYNNKIYNRKIRYDGKKKYIIINKSRIYLKNS